MRKIYLLSLLLASPLSADWWRIESGLGASYRADRTAEKYYRPLNHSEVTFKQSFHFAPIWQGNGFFALLFDAFRFEATASYGAFRNERMKATDYFFINGAPNVASFEMGGWGFVFGLKGEVSYRYKAYKWIENSIDLVPWGAYVYDLLMTQRGNKPLVASNETLRLNQWRQKDLMYGPVVGLDVGFGADQVGRIEGGYGYEFLDFKERFPIQTILAGVTETGSWKVQTAQSYAHYAHLDIQGWVNKHLSVTLKGEATFRYTGKRNQGASETVGSTTFTGPVRVYWSTLMASLFLNYKF
jgi:hypothetical protein